MSESINQIADRFCSSMKSCAECSYGMGNELGVDHCLVKQLSMITYPFESITGFLRKWAAEHPKEHRKTYADDFFEKHPNASCLTGTVGRRSVKYPYVCKLSVYSGRQPIFCATDCAHCWSEPLPESTSKG